MNNITIMMIVIAIIQSVRAYAYKRGLKAISLYLDDMDLIPDEKTIRRYSVRAVRKSKS